MKIMSDKMVQTVPALSSGELALSLRQGGSKTPCRWLSESGIYKVVFA